MTVPTNQTLITRWRHEPAPLLSLLHALHDRDGCLSESALRDVAAALKLPLADLYGTVTFYHHFARTPAGQQAPRVCTGPICRLQGGPELLQALAGAGATAMACAGRCDEPVPVLQGHQVRVGDRHRLELRSTPLPPPNPGGLQECVFREIRTPGRATFAGYEASGGYVGARKAVLEMSPDQLLDLIRESRLAGRGGAGFPTSLKWKSVAEAIGYPKSIVCNADEGEPGCFKDRAILDHDPHAVIEGMIIAAFATGASQGFLYLRYEYPQSLPILERALHDAAAAGLLGDHILGEDFNFRIHLRRGAGAYICGEETSLLNSLEGKHPFPRNRPPYPVTHGYENRPTAVNNVETLASVPQIVCHGPEWYRCLGFSDQAGTKVISLSGDIRQPGNYEVPLGFPLQTLLNEWAGGPLPGRTIQAVTMAGLSGGFLAGADLEVTLDEPSLRRKGSFLGAGGVMVFDDSRNMVEVAHNAMDFFAHESCGKCFPCRIGTQRLTERLAGRAGPTALAPWLEEVTDIGEVMKSFSACGLGVAAPMVTESLLRHFPDQVARHVES